MNDKFAAAYKEWKADLLLGDFFLQNSYRAADSIGLPVIIQIGVPGVSVNNFSDSQIPDGDRTGSVCGMMYFLPNLLKLLNAYLLPEYQ